MIATPTAMRRVDVISDLDLVIEQVSVPVPLAGEAMVQMTIPGVCGSDTHAVHGRRPFIPVLYNPGQAVLGTVRALGEGADSLAVGQRVVVGPTLPCWGCKQCRAGRENEPLSTPVHAVRPDDFITADHPLDDVAQAFAAASSGEHVKVVVRA